LTNAGQATKDKPLRIIGRIAAVAPCES